MLPLTFISIDPARVRNMVFVRFNCQTPLVFPELNDQLNTFLPCALLPACVFVSTRILLGETGKGLLRALSPAPENASSKKVWNLTNCPWNISPGKGGQTFKNQGLCWLPSWMILANIWSSFFLCRLAMQNAVQNTCYYYRFYIIMKVKESIVI